MVASTLQDLPLSDIGPNPGQPRKDFNRSALAELVSSIASVGILQPIVVRPMPGQVPPFQLVSGERRWRASREAGLDTIPSVIRRDLDDRSTFELAMIENVIRSDMNPVEEAQGYQRLLDEGLTVQLISDRLGKRTATIQARLKLLALAPEFLDLVSAGQLDTWTAGCMAKLSREGQHKVARAMAEGLLPQGDMNAVDRLCTAISVRESQAGAFDDPWATPSVLTSFAVFAPVDPAKKAAKERDAIISGALALIEDLGTLIATDYRPSAEEVTRMESLKSAATRLVKTTHTARAQHIASAL